MKNKAAISGGPFDGAELAWDGDCYPCDIIVSTPRKLESDKDDVCRGLTLHQYTNCHSWNEDGVEYHYMGHVSNIAMTMEEVNEMFPPKGPLYNSGNNESSANID
jgi:hypothetical protein